MATGHRATADYSTLEVADVPERFPGKEVVNENDSPIPVYANTNTQTPTSAHTSQQQYPPLPIYKENPQNNTYFNHGKNNTYYAASPIDSNTSAHPFNGGKPLPDPERRQDRRICGVKRKTFWIITGLIAVGVIAAIVGGVVAAVVSKKSSPGGSAGSSGNSSAPVLLSSSSKLAAVNWTDSSKLSHYAVFSQDSTNSILVSMWDSQNQTWTPHNVSDSLAKSGQAISVKAGSPLAAASAGSPFPFLMNLYYLTPSNVIGEVTCSDPTGSTWNVGDLVQSPPITADTNSALASVRHECNFGCSGDVYVVYESNNNIILLNSSNWSTGDQLQVADSGSPLSLFPFIGNGGFNGPKGEFQDNDADLRLYSAEDGALNEYIYVNASWRGGQAALTTGLSSTAPKPQIAVAPFDSWWQILSLVLNSDGTLTGERWDNTTWTRNQHITLSATPSGATFSAIAQHHETRMYGIMNGTIQEYQWNKLNPYAMVYVGPVKFSNSNAGNSTTTTTGS